MRRGDFYRDQVFRICNVSVMLLLMVLTVYPFLHVAFSSISNPTLLVRHQGPLVAPLGFTLGAYDMVFRNPMIRQGYINTLFYVCLGTSLNVALTAVSAYVLSRKGFYIRNVLMFFAVFTMFFSGGLIPYYLQVRSMGLTNTRLSLIFPTAINTFNLIIMRTGFLSVPDSLEESAKIDGAGDFTVLFRIILPLSLPVVSVMVLFYGVWHWNSWFQAMIFLRDRELYPLQLILREILISSSTDSMLTSVAGGDKEPVGETVKYATIMVATVPILFVYPFLQKYFVKGMMIGAIKG
jgi:putative aldouronate transport system permease protein